MQSYADTIVQSFSSMTDDDLNRFEDMSDLELNLTLMQSGIPVEGDNFLTIIEAWKAGIKAVSYTHLDVYKRQVQMSVRRVPLQKCMSIRKSGRR